MRSEVKKSKKYHLRFAEGFCFYKLFLIFVIGCIFGVYYEEILTCVRNYMKSGTVIWELRRGVIYGPFSPIYGAGAVLFLWVLGRKIRPWYQTVLYGALLGGSFEFIVSLFQEIFMGTSSWNYTGQFLSIGGRTTIPLMLGWGIFIAIFIHIIYPWLSKWIERIPIKIGTYVTIGLVIFLSLNMLISWTALLRQTLRRNHIKPLTPIGALYDKIYPDEFLAKYFSNMVPVEK